MTLPEGIDLSTLYSAVNGFSSKGSIDNIKNLANGRAWLFSGQKQDGKLDSVHVFSSPSHSPFRVFPLSRHQRHGGQPRNYEEAAGLLQALHGRQQVWCRTIIT